MRLLATCVVRAVIVFPVTAKIVDGTTKSIKALSPIHFHVETFFHFFLLMDEIIQSFKRIIERFDAIIGRQQLILDTAYNRLFWEGNRPDSSSPTSTEMSQPSKAPRLSPMLEEASVQDLLDKPIVSTSITWASELDESAEAPPSSPMPAHASVQDSVDNAASASTQQQNSCPIPASQEEPKKKSRCISIDSDGVPSFDDLYITDGPKWCKDHRGYPRGAMVHASDIESGNGALGVYYFGAVHVTAKYGHTMCLTSRFKSAIEQKLVNSEFYEHVFEAVPNLSLKDDGSMRLRLHYDECLTAGGAIAPVYRMLALPLKDPTCFATIVFGQPLYHDLKKHDIETLHKAKGYGKNRGCLENRPEHASFLDVSFLRTCNRCPPFN